MNFYNTYINLFIDEFLKDMFNTCGDIRSIRISPKRYAHIQFFNETAVDKAIAFSGKSSFIWSLYFTCSSNCQKFAL